MRKIIPQLAIILALIAILTPILTSNAQYPLQDTLLYVTPTTISEPIGAQFTVTVGITDVVDLSGFDVKFGWNSTVLDYVSHTATPANVLNTTGGTLFTLVDTADAAAGTYELAVATLPATSFTGSGTIFTVTLNVTAVGVSDLKFLQHDLSDPLASPIPHVTMNATFDNRPTVVQYDLAISVLGSGTTDPAVGTHTYDEGTIVPVTATPDSGWTFDHWVLDTVDAGSANPYSVTMNTDHELTAVFLEIPPVQYQLTISVTGSGTTDPAVGSHMYDEGTVVPVTATPASGWTFDHWVLDTVNVGSTNPYSVTMDANHALEAVFVEVPPVQYQLTISVTGSGTTDPAVGSYMYDEGTVVPVTATPASGWSLDYWLLDSVNVGNTNPYSVTMDSDYTLEAVFVEIPPVQYELTISVTGMGTTNPTVGSYMYDEGTVVPVTATPDSGWTFDHWLLDSVDVGSTNPYSVTMDANHVLTAVFVEVIPPVQYQLTITVTGSGTTDPAVGSYMYDEGTVVPVTAFPTSGWSLDYWLLDSVNVGNTNPYSVTMDSDHTLEAVFIEVPPVQYELTITVTGMGTTNPALGTYLYDAGTIVDVTATADSGWTFDHWMLDSVNVGSANPYSVTMDADHALEAVFVEVIPPVQYELTITVTGSGTTSPAVGSYMYDEGTVVPVTAMPDSGWMLDHWVLDSVDVGSVNPYSVTMDANHALEAVFVEAPPVEYELTITVTGSGTTSPVVGTYPYTAGSVIDVTANPDSGWLFDHWLLDLVNVGSANPYSVTMDSDHTLTAVFVEVPPVQYELAITVTGMGTTSPAPGTYMYDADTIIDVTAIADSGWTFDHWVLDSVDVGSANPYSVTMNSDHTLTAVFAEAAPPTEKGKPPAYWAHQFKVHYKGHGHAQESWDDLVAWTAAINAYYGVTPPDFYGTKLPPVSAMDLDGDGVFEPWEAYKILRNNKTHKNLRLGCANWFNWAAGYKPFPPRHHWHCHPVRPGHHLPPACPPCSWRRPGFP